jgi:hypothetical protein
MLVSLEMCGFLATRFGRAGFLGCATSLRLPVYPTAYAAVLRPVLNDLKSS